MQRYYVAVWTRGGMRRESYLVTGAEGRLRAFRGELLED
jgi:hypothetical protein